MTGESGRPAWAVSDGLTTVGHRRQVLRDVAAGVAASLTDDAERERRRQTGPESDNGEFR